jgi:microtubule-associated protein tau
VLQIESHKLELFVLQVESQKLGLFVLQIESQKLEFKAESKVGSLANVKHKPGGGDIKIFDDKLYLKQRSGGASSIASSEEGHISGTQVITAHSMIILTDSRGVRLHFCNIFYRIIIIIIIIIT